MRMSGKSLSRLGTLRRRLLAWYRSSARPLPWRKTHNPYRILVSEVMLQQTQVNRVLIHYRRFLNRFPTLRSLSRAGTADVLRAWRGMGYNNRAVRLRNLAKEVCATMGGRLPGTVGALRSLPGIGRYTAGAVACFAFGLPVAMVDTNIQRVLNRLFPAPQKGSDIWRTAEDILPSKNAYSWNQALMELGALICTASSPRCSDCPVNALCPSAFAVRSTFRKPAKADPGKDGIPDRIYRGRIIEVLRHLDGGRSIHVRQLGKRIKRNFTAGDLPWLRTLLSGLVRDGLVFLRARSGNEYVSFAE